jgi:hypothetical protein
LPAVSAMPASPFWRLWGWPIAIGILTTSGLLSALVSDAWGDFWSWIALGLPVAVMCWYGWRRPSTARAADAASSSPAPVTRQTP